MDTLYVERKCQACKQIFEVRFDKQNTLYGDYCANCFVWHVSEDIYGYLRLKSEEETERDTSYKNELQGITHRGKIRVQK